MQKLNKSSFRGNKYWEWYIKNYNLRNIKYDDNSLKQQFYDDIVANLIKIQKGVCAYSERKISELSLIENEGNWTVDGFKIGNLLAGMRIWGAINLDHWNPKLKNTCGWSWDNFFLVDTKINQIKNDRIPKILKPDSEIYDPFKYLDYDFNNLKFAVSQNIKDVSEFQDIQNDIKILGLNSVYSYCIERQATIIKAFIKYHAIREKTEENIHSFFNKEKQFLSEYFTAFEMSVLNKNYLTYLDGNYETEIIINLGRYKSRFCKDSLIKN